MVKPDNGAGSLRDTLVLDLSRVLSGPYAAMILGDLGARVIKVERPGAGDDTRSWGPPFVGTPEAFESTYFLSINRNKESITLDFKDEADREVLFDLIRRADVVIENFRPGVLTRLGLGVEEMHELNPAAVIVSITGFGHDGPDAGRSGYDQIVQGEAGVMSVTGDGPGHSVKVGIPVGDIQAGMFAAMGALAALHERTLTGKGSVVRTSLLSALVATHTFQGTRWLAGGQIPEPTGNRHPTVAPYGAFTCRDGQIQIAIGNNSLWRNFAPMIGLDPLDERFLTNQDRAGRVEELEKLINDALSSQDVAVWFNRLEEAGIPVGRIRSIDQVYADPQVISQNLIIKTTHPTAGSLQLPGSPLRIETEGHAPRTEHLPPPTLGEHSQQIRAWLAHDPVVSR